VLRLCSLGSGSSGNSLVAEAKDGLATTRILVDNGFNLRQLTRRLARAGLGVESLAGIFVTHEHSDHSAGVAALSRRHGVPVYCTAGTASACSFAELGVEWIRIAAGTVVELGALRVEAYAVPHDASEPVQYTFTDGSRRAGLLTDAGESSDNIVQALGGLDALVLECNHDLQMLQQGAYPGFLKRRIAGDLGHLSNEQAAAILGSVDRSRLRWVAAAHLSAANNRPELAQRALAGILQCESREVLVAEQSAGLDWHAA
jgi:phosphoribosyl 1,2-cyclic phosphodiesterase